MGFALCVCLTVGFKGDIEMFWFCFLLVMTGFLYVD